MKKIIGFVVVSLFSLINTKAQSNQYKYDNVGRLVQTIYPSQIMITYSYDNDGNRTLFVTNICANRPKAKITTINNTTICIGDSVILKSDSATFYKWSTGAATQSIVVKTSSNDTLIVTNQFGCSDTTSITITVNPLPIVNITASASILCKGMPDTLSVTGATSYKWTGPNLVDSLSAKIMVTPPMGSNTYTVTGTTNGCSASKSIAVTINPLPHITDSVTPNPICSGNTITLIAKGANNYTWNGSNLNKTTGDTITASPTISGNLIYTVIGTATNGCIDSLKIPITVNPNPQISTQPLASQSICLNATPSNLKVVVNGIGAFNFQWYKNTANTITNGTAITNANTDNYTPPTTSAGTLYYYCTITQPSVTCSTTSTIAQVVVRDTVPNVTINQTSCIGGAVSFALSAVSGGGSLPQYQWQQRKIGTLPWLDSVGATGTTFQIAQASNGTQVRLKLTSNAACARPSVVYSDSSIVSCVVTAITSPPASVDSFNVYPNPTTGDVFIILNLNTPKDVFFELFDPLGKLFYQSSKKRLFGKNRIHLPVTLKISGAYILQTFIDKDHFPKIILK